MIVNHIAKFRIFAILFFQTVGIVQPVERGIACQNGNVLYCCIAGKNLFAVGISLLFFLRVDLKNKIRMVSVPRHCSRQAQQIRLCEAWRGGVGLFQQESAQVYHETLERQETYCNLSGTQQEIWREQWREIRHPVKRF